MERNTCKNKIKMLLLFFADLLKWDLCEGSGGSSDESESVGSGGVYRSSGVILFFTALRRYRISRESSGWKRCIWILGVAGLAVALGIFARNETVVCGIGNACFTMALLQFIDVVRTRE